MNVRGRDGRNIKEGIVPSAEGKGDSKGLTQSTSLEVLKLEHL